MRLLLNNFAPEHVRSTMKSEVEVEGKAANFSAKLNCDALSDYCIEWIAFFDEKGDAAFDGDKET